MKKLSVFLLVLALFAATDAKAFGIFEKTAGDAPVATTTATDVKAPDATVTNTDKTVPVATPATAPTVATTTEKKKEADPLLKEVSELQQKHYTEMMKQEAEFVAKKAELLAKYKAKMEKENPGKLQDYIKQCETQAIQRYMNEQNPELGGMMMQNMPGMPIMPNMIPTPAK